MDQDLLQIKMPSENSLYDGGSKGIVIIPPVSGKEIQAKLVEVLENVPWINPLPPQRRQDNLPLLIKT